MSDEEVAVGTSKGVDLTEQGREESFLVDVTGDDNSASHAATSAPVPALAAPNTLTVAAMPVAHDGRSSTASLERLVKAIKRNDDPQVQQLVQQDASIVNGTVSGVTPLLMAARWGRDNMVPLLIEVGTHIRTFSVENLSAEIDAPQFTCRILRIFASALFSLVPMSIL